MQIFVYRSLNTRLMQRILLAGMALIFIAGCDIITPRAGGGLAPSDVSLSKEVCCRVSHLNEAEKFYRPSQMLIRDDGGFAFAGSFAGRPVVWRYTARLEEEWEKRLLQDRPCSLGPNKSSDSFYASCDVDGYNEYLSIDLEGNVRSLFITPVSGVPIPTSDGGFLATRTAGSSIHRNVRVSRLDASGSLLWEHYFDDVSIQHVQYFDGTTIAVGDIPGELWWHPRDAIMIGIGPDGSETWRRTFECEDGCRIDKAFRLDGGFLLAGHKKESVQTGPDSFMTLEAEWLVMVDTSGDILWDSWEHWQEPQGFGEIRLVRTSHRGIEFVGYNSEDRRHHSVLLDADGRINAQETWPTLDVGRCGVEDYAFKGDREIALLYGCNSLSCFRGSCTGDTFARVLVVR
jgi:hypothetical protein